MNPAPRVGVYPTLSCKQAATLAAVAVNIFHGVYPTLSCKQAATMPLHRTHRPASLSNPILQASRNRVRKVSEGPVPVVPPPGKFRATRERDEFCSLDPFLGAPLRVE